MNDITHDSMDEMTEDAVSEAVEAPVRDDDANPVESPEDAPESAPESDSENDGKKGNSEAAKWRVKFREAEATIAALEARVGDMQAAEVARLAQGPGRLHDGGDLLLTAQLADLLDDEGAVDSEKVSEAVNALTEKKPHLAKPAFENGVGVGEKGTGGTASWAQVIAS